MASVEPPTEEVRIASAQAPYGRWRSRPWGPRNRPWCRRSRAHGIGGTDSMASVESPRIAYAVGARSAQPPMGSMQPPMWSARWGRRGRLWAGGAAPQLGETVHGASAETLPPNAPLRACPQCPDPAINVSNASGGGGSEPAAAPQRPGAAPPTTEGTDARPPFARHLPAIPGPTPPPGPRSKYMLGPT